MAREIVSTLSRLHHYVGLSGGCGLRMQGRVMLLVDPPSTASPIRAQGALTIEPGFVRPSFGARPRDWLSACH